MDNLDNNSSFGCDVKFDETTYDVESDFVDVDKSEEPLGENRGRFDSYSMDGKVKGLTPTASSFAAFLREVAETSFPLAVTASGSRIIAQSDRNRLRQKGLEALESDLRALFDSEFDVVRTKDGLVIVAENDGENPFTFSWELKSTIKSLDYDPFIEADNYSEAQEAKRAKKEASERAKKEREAVVSAKRAEKVAEIEARKANRGSREAN